MAQSPYAAGKYSKGICGRCGWKYPLHKLRFESLAAKDAPSQQSSELRVCPTCFDPPHPISNLPRVIAAHGADPQQVWKPRPDTFPIAYSVRYVPNSIPQGTSGIQVLASAVFGQGPFLGSSDDPQIGVLSVTQIGPTKAIVVMNVSNAALLGQHVIGISDSKGQLLKGLITVTKGSQMDDGLWGNELFDDASFGGPTGQ